MIGILALGIITLVCAMVCGAGLMLLGDPKYSEITEGKLVMFFLMSLVSLILFGLSIYTDSNRLRDIKECELDLPRTEECVLIAVPEKTLEEEK